MAQQITATNVRRIDDNASVIDIHGEITARSEQQLMDAYARASGDRTRAIIMNFSELEYMNSGGIGLLVTMLVRANRQKQRLSAYGLNEHYRQIFELTRLDEAIAIHDGEAAAIDAAKGELREGPR
jgi:anti-sigma B factor antagonist